MTHSKPLVERLVERRQFVNRQRPGKRDVPEQTFGRFDDACQFVGEVVNPSGPLACIARGVGCQCQYVFLQADIAPFLLQQPQDRVDFRSFDGSPGRDVERAVSSKRWPRCAMSCARSRRESSVTCASRTRRSSHGPSRTRRPSSEVRSLASE